MSVITEPCLFCCARCLQPIHIEKEFDKLSDYQLAELNRNLSIICVLILKIN